MDDAESFSIGDTLKVDFTDGSKRETRYFVFETEDTTCTIKNLQSGKVYYFVFRPFLNVMGGKKYGALRNVKSVKIK